MTRLMSKMSATDTEGFLLKKTIPPSTNQKLVFAPVRLLLAALLMFYQSFLLSSGAAQVFVGHGREAEMPWLRTGTF